MIKKVLAAYKKDLVAGASEVITAYRYILGKHNGQDVVSVFYRAIEEELSAEIGLMHLERIMPRKMYTSEFREWIAKMDKREMKIYIERHGVFEENEKELFLNEFGEMKERVVKIKYKIEAHEDENGNVYGEQIEIGKGE